MAMTKFTRIAIVGLGLVIFIAVGFLVFGPRDSLTGGPPAGAPPVITITVDLVDDPNGGCIVGSPGKTDEMEIEGESRQIRWIINHAGCKDKQALVTLGNFRKTGTPSGANCHDAKTAGADGLWLFAQPESRNQRQSHSVIPLTTKRRAQVPEATYDYDICTGLNADKKSDPRLVIDY